jgi:ABC-2 type transport system permease protein
MMRLILAIIRKEFIQLRRDPRLVGFIIVMPIILTTLFGYALKLEPDNVKMAYVDEDFSMFSNLIKTNIWNEGYFKLYEVENVAQIKDEIRLGHARAGLYIPADFSAELVDNNQPSVNLYIDGTMPSLATAMDNNSSAITAEAVTTDMYFSDPDEPAVVIAQDPFNLDVETLFNPDKIETWFFLPGVVGILIMQVALILTSTTVVRERENNTLEQLLVSPMTRTQFILGKIIPYVIISLVDFYAILGFSWLVFDLPEPGSHTVLFLLASVYLAALITMGLAISTISQTQQQAIFISIFVLIPSILLSGFIFPVEAMPYYIQPVAYAIPFTYFVDIIRGILLKGNTFIEMIPQFMALAGFTLLFTFFSIFRFRKTLA